MCGNRQVARWWIFYIQIDLILCSYTHPDSLCAGGVGWEAGSGCGVCSVGQCTAEWNSVCPWGGGAEWWRYQYPAPPHSLWDWAKARPRETPGKFSAREPRFYYFLHPFHSQVFKEMYNFKFFIVQVDHQFSNTGWTDTYFKPANILTSIKLAYWSSSRYCVSPATAPCFLPPT